MAIAKLSAMAAGGALVGGGAVHVAEAPAAQVRYAKTAQAAPAKRVKEPRVTAQRVAQAPRQTKRIRRVVARTTTCAPTQPDMAMRPVPAPYMPPLPP
ncbi:MAG TPA: PEP-CTERM sorting domain-containing protein, partial [Novosphingobium sp.]|nr:PEP-CTERM sorting domain-containing protein [Novosphingobium sp.]